MKIFAAMLVVILTGAFALAQTGSSDTSTTPPKTEKGSSKKSKEKPKDHKGGNQEKKQTGKKT